MTGTPLSPLPETALRWRCDEGQFAFETTAELPDFAGALGQERAAEALRFGARAAATSVAVVVSAADDVESARASAARLLAPTEARISLLPGLRSAPAILQASGAVRADTLLVVR